MQLLAGVRVLKCALKVLVGETAPDVIEIVEDGVKYGVDVRVGHKTGFYIDQREVVFQHSVLRKNSVVVMVAG